MQNRPTVRRTGSKRKNRRADRSGETSQTQGGENAGDNSARQEDRAMTKLETLDNLVKICVDSAERYRRAAADVGKEKLVLFFNQQEAARRRQADELNMERKRLGGEGEESGKESGSVGGFIDRTAMDLSVVMSMGDTGVVEWCRQDAKDVIAEYGKAPKQEFPATTRSTLERQLAENLATLAALEKVLKPYGHPRS
jgi:uncharacterized protein (TIGR02284 family)